MIQKAYSSFDKKDIFTLQMKHPIPILGSTIPLLFGLLFLIFGVLYHLNRRPKISHWYLDLSTENILFLLGIVTFSFFIYLLLVIFYQISHKNSLNPLPPRTSSQFHTFATPLLITILFLIILLQQIFSIDISLLLEIVIFLFSIHVLSLVCAIWFYKVETRFYTMDAGIFALTITRFSFPGLFYKQQYYWYPDHDSSLNFTITELVSRKEHKSVRNAVEYHFLTLEESAKLKTLHNDFFLSLYDNQIVSTNQPKGYVIRTHATYEEIVKILDIISSKGKCSVIKLEKHGTTKYDYLGIEY